MTQRQLAFLVGIGMALVTGCQRSTEFPSRPITLVCPWAIGGGTDMVSRQIAIYLEQELGAPVNVINATGGKGVTGHRRSLTARPDGYTLGMITLELNTMHWVNLTQLTYADCIPLMSVNEDYCALFVMADAPWQTLSELEQAIRDSPKTYTCSGTSSGGAWHLAVAGWLIEMGLDVADVKWISSTGAGPSLQELISGGLDMVACSLPEADALLAAGKIRALGVMSPQRAIGYDDVATFEEQGRPWSLGGWRGLAVPLGTAPEIVEKLTLALDRIVAGETTVQGQTFPRFMQAQKFDSTSRRRDDFARFMAETDAKFGKLLTSPAMSAVTANRFNPMMFPYLVMAGMGVLFLGIVVPGIIRRRPSVRAPLHPAAAEIPWPTPRGMLNFAAFVVAAIVYVLFVETVGFVLLTAVILFCLLAWMRTRMTTAAIIAMTFTPLVYQLFAVVLRVSLPRGWLGW